MREVNMSDFDSVRVVDEPTAVSLIGVSRDTWNRLRARGEGPPVTKLSERRLGYRIADLKDWLDARRVDRATA
jgi:predicted DNA-binding transcriptional regulator AlpA